MCSEDTQVWLHSCVSSGLMDLKQSAPTTATIQTRPMFQRSVNEMRAVLFCEVLNLGCCSTTVLRQNFWGEMGQSQTLQTAVRPCFKVCYWDILPKRNPFAAEEEAFRRGFSMNGGYFLQPVCLKPFQTILSFVFNISLSLTAIRLPWIVNHKSEESFLCVGEFLCCVWPKCI